MIAVTGANGLLGSFIVRELVKQKSAFIALKRKDSNITHLNDIQHQITWKDVDIQDSVALNEELSGIKQVIHAAGLVSVDPRDRKNLYQVNVIGTRNVVNACLINNVEKLLFVSSVAALGRPKQNITINEHQQWIKSPLNSFYGESKYLAELEVYRAHEEGLQTCIINPSVILAPYNDWDRSSAQLFKYVWQEKKMYTAGSINYVDVRDVVSLVLTLLARPCQGERFIASAGSVSYASFFNKVAKKLNKKPPSIQVGPKLLRLIARLMEIVSFTTRIKPLITMETARLANAEIFFSNEKIKNTLNFEFQSLEETLDYCCEYYLRHLIGEN